MGGGKTKFVEAFMEYQLPEDYYPSDIHLYAAKTYSMLFQGIADWFLANPTYVPLAVTLLSEEVATRTQNVRLTVFIEKCDAN
jgi:hypothetical protein